MSGGTSSEEIPVPVYMHDDETGPRVAAPPAVRRPAGELINGFKPIPDAFKWREVGSGEDLAPEFATGYKFTGRQHPAFFKAVERAEGSTSSRTLSDKMAFAVDWSALKLEPSWVKMLSYCIPRVGEVKFDWFGGSPGTKQTDVLRRSLAMVAAVVDVEARVVLMTPKMFDPVLLERVLAFNLEGPSQPRTRDTELLVSLAESVKAMASMMSGPQGAAPAAAKQAPPKKPRFPRRKVQPGVMFDATSPCLAPYALYSTTPPATVDINLRATAKKSGNPKEVARAMLISGLSYCGLAVKSALVQAECVENDWMVTLSNAVGAALFTVKLPEGPMMNASKGYTTKARLGTKPAKIKAIEYIHAGEPTDTPTQLAGAEAFFNWYGIVSTAARGAGLPVESMFDGTGCAFLHA